MEKIKTKISEAYLDTCIWLYTTGMHVVEMTMYYFVKLYGMVESLCSQNSNRK